jgi:uncharacterized protein (DUF849 family)
MKKKRIINCSITGSIHTPSMSPYLPITPDQIAQSALEAASAGAATVHIHARNPENGQPTADLNLYEEIVDKIRAKNKEVVICVTTGGGPAMTVEQRIGAVPRLKPQLASMNAGSLTWGLFPMLGKMKEFKYAWEKEMLEMTRGYIFKNSFEDMEYMLSTMNENDTKAEFECYEVGHIYNVKYLQNTGFIKGKPYLQFVLGILGGISSSPYDLINMKDTADRLFGTDGYEWSAFGAGRAEYPICMQSLLLGGNVRVGLEDNLYLKKGVFAKSNAELVEKMARLMTELDIEIATPAEAKVILGLE